MCKVFNECQRISYVSRLQIPPSPPYLVFSIRYSMAIANYEYFAADRLSSSPALQRKFPQAFLGRGVSWLELTNNLIFPLSIVVISGPSVLLCLMEQLWNLFADEAFILLNGGFSLARSYS